MNEWEQSFTTFSWVEYARKAFQGIPTHLLIPLPQFGPGFNNFKRILRRTLDARDVQTLDNVVSTKSVVGTEDAFEAEQTDDQNSHINFEDR